VFPRGARCCCVGTLRGQVREEMHPEYALVLEGAWYAYACTSSSAMMCRVEDMESELDGDGRSSQVRVNVSRCCLAGYSEVLTESEQCKAV
jgi:hypothetical protein